MIWGTETVVWAWLDKIFTPGFYSYMKNSDNFSNAPAMTGDAYEDMRYALEMNNVCTDWQPQHRIQFAHSKGDMVVPYGNYLSFRDAHLSVENDMFRVDDTFSDSDHVKSGSQFLIKLGTYFFDYFQWIDAAQPTGITSIADERSLKSDKWYDLSGRMLDSRPTKKGIYVVNGKKVVIK